MGDFTKAKINLRTGEIELEGSEEFVQRQLNDLRNLLNLLKKHALLAEETVQEESEGVPATKEEVKRVERDTDLAVPVSFGEWYHKFPAKLSQNDQVLLAGYFAQKQSKENTFKTAQTNKLLKDQGTKVANAAQALKYMLKRKLVFIVSKKGRLSNFRVASPGEEYLKKLLHKPKSKSKKKT